MVLVNLIQFLASLSMFIFVLALIHLPKTNAIKTCRRPPYGNQYVGRDQECAALVQTKCPSVGHSTTWTPGVKVKDNCSTLPKYIAIATFNGPGRTYNTPPDYKNQHTAIFESCDRYGITVYDQYTRSNGVRRRVLRYGGRRVNNGDMYYVIN